MIRTYDSGRMNRYDIMLEKILGSSETLDDFPVI